MFDFLNTEDLLKSVEGKTYEKNEVVKFTIKEVKEFPKYQTIAVTCNDEAGDTYTFKLGTNTPSKKKLMISFLSAFFTREQLLEKKMQPVELIGQRFEVKSDGQMDYEGKMFQRWTPNFRKIQEIASAEEFTS